MRTKVHSPSRRPLSSEPKTRLGARCLRGALLALLVQAGMACDSGPATDNGGVGTIQSQIKATGSSLSNDVVLGFEAAGAWSTTTTGATLAQSTVHSQGGASLSIKPSSSNGYTPLVSVPLSTLAQVSSVLAVDVMLPSYQPNPQWLGTMQVTLNAPSRSLYSQFLGQVELTGKPLNVWNTVTFPMNNRYITALLNGGYSDLAITIALNVQVPTTGTYYVDNLRFIPASSSGCSGLPNGTACSDNNACTTGDTCQSNTCRSGAAVNCPAADQCHQAGVCNRTTGVCAYAIKPNGTACNDGSACTTGDVCQQGECHGSGVCAADFSVTPGSIDFGTVTIGSTPAIDITVTNTGTAAGVPSLSVAGANASEFSLSPSAGAVAACTATTSLAPGASCRTAAHFSPLSSGAKSATIAVGGVTKATMTAIAAAASAAFTVTPNPVDLGTVMLVAITTREIAVTNTGTAPGTPVFTVVGDAASEFSIVSSASQDNPCTSSTVLAVGATCHAFAQVAPVTPGAKTATVKIGDAVALTIVVVVANGATYAIEPASVDFGAVPINAQSFTQIRVTNTGTVEGTPRLLVVGSQEFSTNPGPDNPCTQDTVLQPGDSCGAFVRFVPMTFGAHSAVVNIGNAQLLTLTATVPPGGQFTVTPSVIDFGEVALVSTAAREVAVTNTGTAPAYPAFMVRGENAAELSVSSVAGEDNPCDVDTLLGVGETCHTFVRMAPLTPGPKSGYVQMNNAVAVTISAVVPNAATYVIDPASVDFGSVPINAGSASEIRVTNTGTVAGTPRLFVAGSQEFSVSSNSAETNPCTQDTVLQPGEACRTFVSFVPMTFGQHTAVVKIGNAPLLSVTATVPPGGQFTVTPDAIDFGTVLLVARSVHEIAVTNVGTAPAYPSFMLRGVDYAEFSVSSIPEEVNPCDERTLLGVGETCHTRVTFAPVTPGAKSAHVQMNNSVVLTMAGVVPPGATYSVSPDTVVFDTPLGARSFIEIAVRNTGTTSGSPYLWIDGPQASELSVGSQANEDNPCTAETVLAPNAVCHTFVTYVPVSTGSKSARLMIFNAPVMSISAYLAPAL